MEGKRYKSPMRKLLRFFKKSRDGWKCKCREAKVQVKRLGNRVRSLDKSRNRWKEQAMGRREELRQLRRELEKQKRLAC
ncbi:MAG: hypothetical protein GY906_32390 [bacterium]|nr:hypothetical protein [bacterium]